MSDINFPSNPSVDEEHTDDNGLLWIYNGKTWERTFSDIRQPTTSMNTIDDVDVGIMNNYGKRFLLKDETGTYVQKPLNIIIQPEDIFCLAYSNDNTFVPVTETEQFVPYDTVWKKSDAGTFDAVNYEYTIPTKGYWQIDARIIYPIARLSIKMWMYKNGSKERVVAQEQSGYGNSQMNCNPCIFEHFNVGDKIKFSTYGIYVATVSFDHGYQYSCFNSRLIQAT